MAAYKDVFVDTWKAAGDLSTKQNLFVKVSAADTVDVCAAATDKPVGVLRTKPAAAGREAEVVHIGRALVIAGGTVTAGDTVGTDNAGKAVTYAHGTATTSYACGIARTGGASGEVIEVELSCLPPTRMA
jgi:hypothetical protein